MKKGNSIYVEGKINTRKWEDKEGVTRYSTDIIADKMTMLVSRSNNSSSAATAVSQAESSPTKSSGNDDLPF